MPRKLSFETVKAALSTLSRGDLVALKGEIERLLVAEESGQRLPAGRKRLRKAGKPSPGSQWVEYKRIRGYGPYAYLRTVESDGRVSSHYLGKAGLAAGSKDSGQGG